MPLKYLFIEKGKVDQALQLLDSNNVTVSTDESYKDPVKRVVSKKLGKCFTVQELARLADNNISYN